MPAADHPLSKTEHAYRTLRSEILLAHLRPGHLVRFAIGLEAVQDLQRDLAQALARAF